MADINYSISPEVFDKFPGYCRGVVLAFELHNGASPQSLVQKLRAAETALRTQLTVEEIAENVRIKPWREAYKAFGAKPNEFRLSVEAMARRVLRGDSLPSINALVDIGNIVSLQHLLPVGGHSMDEIRQDITLRFASGDETFIPFGSTDIEHPLPGEVIFVEGQTVLTRRWTWRQANHTLVLPGSKSVEINIDRLPPIELDEVRLIASQLMELVSEFCGGWQRYEILSASHTTMNLA